MTTTTLQPQARRVWTRLERVAFTLCLAGGGGIALASFLGEAFGARAFIQASGAGLMAPLAALLILVMALALALVHWGGGRAWVRPAVIFLAVLLAAVAVMYGLRNVWGQAPFLPWEDALLTDAAARAGYIMTRLSTVAAGMGLVAAVTLLILVTPRWQRDPVRLACVVAAMILVSFGVFSAMGFAAKLPLFVVFGRRLAPWTSISLSLIMLAYAIQVGLRRCLLGVFFAEARADEADGKAFFPSIPWPMVCAGWAAVALTLGVAQTVIYSLGREAWTKQQHLMAALAEIAVARISAWRTERLADARTLAHTPILLRITAGPGPSPDELREARDYFDEVRRSYGYRAVEVYDRNLAPMLASPAALPARRSALVDESLRGGVAPVVRDIFAGENGALLMEFAMPIRQRRNGEFLGALLLRVDVRDGLFELLQMWPGQWETLEAVLVRRAGNGLEYLSPFRQGGPKELPHYLDFSDSRRAAVRQLRNGEPGMVEAVDYRDAPVLVLGRPVPTTPWYFVIKVDSIEATRQARITAWAVGLGFVLTMGTIGLMAGRYWHGRQRREADLRRRAEQEKFLAEERLGVLMRSANDVVLLYDEDTRVVDANDRVREFYGREPREMVGLLARDLRAVGSTGGLGGDFQATFREGGRVYETVHHRKDGTEFPVEISARPVILEGRRYVLSTVRDITDRRERDREIERLNRMYLVISHVSHAIVHLSSRRELFQEVCRVMVELGRFRLAWIGWVEDDTRQVLPVAVAGDERGFVSSLQVSPDPASPSGADPVATAVREDRAVIVNDVLHEASTVRWREEAARSDVRSSATLPVRFGGRVVAVLSVAAVEKDFFGPAMAQLIEEAAGDVGFALTVFARDEERRKAQEALREREEIFSSMVGNAMDAMLLLDESGRAVEFNRAAHEMFGYTREEFARLSLRDLNADQDDRVLQENIGLVMRSGRLEFEAVHRHKDGSLRDVLVRAGALRIRGTGFMAAIWSDITARKRIEAELRASEERHRTLYESMDIGVVYQDASGAITAANRAAQHVLGLTLDQLQGRTSMDPQWRACREDGTVFPGHEHPSMVALRTGMRVNGVVMGIRSGAGAELRWLSVDAVPETAPGAARPHRVFAIFTDITARLQSERELRQLNAAVEQSPASVVITDLAGAIEYVNPRFTEFTGYTLAEVRGRNPRVLKSGLTPQSVYEDLWRTIAGGKVWRGELVNRKKNGETFTELVVITPVRDAYGNLYRYLALKEDISERKRMEETLRESESRYRLIADNTGDIIWLYNLIAQRFEYISPSVRRLRGFTVEEAMNNGLIDSLAPESVEEMKRALPARLAAFAAGDETARDATYRVSFLRKDGTAFPAEVSTTVVGDAEGRPAKIIGVTHDVTEPRRLEAALRVQEARLRQTLLETPLAMVTVDANGRILLRNRRFDRLVGYTAEELTDAESWFRLAYPDPDYREHVRRKWEAEVASAQRQNREVPPGEYRVRTKDGRTVIVEIAAVVLGDELLVTFADLTERRLAEGESRKLLRAVEQSPVSILITDLQGAIEYVNPHFSAVTGYSFEEVRGQNPRLLKSGRMPPEVYEQMWARLRSGCVWRGELQNRKKNGELFTELAVIAPVTEADGILTHFVSVTEDITARKRTEETLRESEERYRLIADNTSDVIWIIELGSRQFSYVSPAIERLLGYRPEELLGSTFDPLITPAALPAVVENIERRAQAFLAGDQAARHRRFVTDLVHRDGHVVIGELVSTFLAGSDGVPRQVLGIVRDISERARMALELEKRVRELRVMHDVAQLMERERNVTAATLQGIVDLLPGLTDRPASARAVLEARDVVCSAGAEGEMTLSVSEPITVNESPAGRLTLGCVPAGGETAAPATLPDSEVMQNLARTIGLGLGARESFAAIRRFNSELEARVAERTAEIESRNREVQALLQSIPDLIVRMRDDGTVVYSQSAGGGEALGLLQAPAGTATLHPFDPELSDRLLAAGREALAAVEAVQREIEVAQPDGGLILELRAAPLGTREFVVLVRDITARKRLESEVAAALEKERQISEMKTRFISVTSHEFRTPMAAAVGTLGLLRAHLDRLAPERREVMFERIAHSLGRMTTMLDDILLLNRIDAGRVPLKLGPVNLRLFVQTVVDEARMADREAHEFQLVSEGAVEPVLTDSSLLHHILSNLLSNAARYSPAGTAVETRLRIEPGRVIISVADRGIGIPEPDLARIFEPFERGSNVGTTPGTGLGLNIVRRMTQLLGGTIEVESKVGQGSRFVLEFPRPDAR